MRRGSELRMLYDHRRDKQHSLYVLRDCDEDLRASVQRLLYRSGWQMPHMFLCARCKEGRVPRVLSVPLLTKQPDQQRNEPSDESMWDGYLR